jgi:SAM-dependent methyltransferase
MRRMPPITQFAPAKLETLHACPYCGGTRLDYLFVERGYPYVECHACGLILLATRLREQFLGEIYDADGYHTGEPTNATRRTALKRVALLGTLSPSAKVVEDGAGNGLFVSACRASGFDAIGCDLGADAVAKAEQAAGVKLQLGTLADLNLQDSSVDAVASFNLLSHLYRPWEYVREVARVLRPGGVWLTRVGDKHGWKKRLARGNWSAPEHVFHYPLALVERMAQEAGLRASLVKPAFDSDFPNLPGLNGRAKNGAVRAVLGRANQLVLGAWVLLELPRDDYYLRFVK